MRPSAGIWVDAAAVAACVGVLGSWMTLANLPPSFRQVLGAYPRCDSLRFDVEISSGGAVPDVSHFALDCSGNSRVDSDAFSTVVNVREGALLRLDHRERVAETSPVNDRVLRETQRQARFDPRFITGSVTRLAETQTLGGHQCWGWTSEYKDSSLEVWADSDGEICEMISRSAAGEMTARLTRFRFHQDFPERTFSLAVPPGYRKPTP